MTRATAYLRWLIVLIGIVLMPIAGCCGSKCPYAADGARCGQRPHVRGAYLALVPAQPPNGSYPPGTEIRGSEIIFRGATAKNDILAYFDVTVRDWGRLSDDSRPEDESGSIGSGNAVGGCLYSQNLQVMCTSSISRQDCEAKSCSEFHSGMGCNEIDTSADFADLCLGGVKISGGINPDIKPPEVAPPPEPICAPGSRDVVGWITAEFSCGQFGEPVLEDVEEITGRPPCKKGLGLRAGTRGPRSDRGSTECLATLRVTIAPEIQPGRGERARTIRVELNGDDGGERSQPTLTGARGRRIAVDGTGAGFLTVEPPR